MRLIDADSVLERLSVFKDDPDAEESTHHFMYGIETAREVIESEPTIEPEPARVLTYDEAYENAWMYMDMPDSSTPVFVQFRHEVNYDEGTIPPWRGGHNQRRLLDRRDAYGSRFVFWTKRPTPEQMESMPWEDGA